MAANPFDQFDAPTAKGASSNPFDRFDAPGAEAPTAPATPGFIPTVKRTAGQMLTGAATTLEDITGANRVTEGLRSTGQGIIERNPAGINSLADIAESPWLTVKEAVGNMVPQIGAGIAGRVAGAKIGAKIGGQAAGGRGALVGGITGALAPVFVQEYGGIRDEQKAGGQESIPRALGAAGVATGLELLGPEGRIAAKGVNALTRTGKQIAKQAGRDVLVEGATEGAQTVVEQVGAFKDPREAKNLEETAVSSVLGGIGGGVVGGVHAGVGAALAPRQQPAPTEDAPQPQIDSEPLTAEVVRAQKLPDTGPLSAAVNAGIEQEAQTVEQAAARVAAVVDPLAQREADRPPEPTGEPMPGDIMGSNGAPFTTMRAAMRALESAGQGYELAPVRGGLVVRYSGPPEMREFIGENDSGPLTIDSGTLTPGLEQSELTLEEANALASGAQPQAPTRRIPAPKVQEIGSIETVEPAPPMEAPGTERTPRQRAGEAVEIPSMEIDREGRLAVARYLSQMRRTNTPAARAFMQDFEAGRITRADVLRLVRPLTPAAEPTPDQRLAAAAAQAPQQQGTDSLLLTGDGFPYGTPAAAVQRASREKLDAGSVIEVAGGYAVRPRDLGAGLEPKGPPDPKATRTPPSASSAPIAPATSPAAEPTTTVVPQVARSTGQTEAVTTSAAAPDSTQAPAPAAGVTVAAAPDTTVPRPERLRNGFIRYRFTTAEDMDGQVSIAPPGWRKGSKSFVVSLDRTGGPKDERGQTKFYRTEDLGKYRTEEAARAAAEGFVRQYRKSAPAAAPTESAAQPTQGETDGQEQGLQGRRTEEVAPRRAPVTPQVASQQQIDSFIGIAADSVQRLRSQDVDRVISETPAHFRLSVAEHIKTKRADLAETVDEALAENPEQRPAPPVAESQAPARSADGDAGIAPGQESGAPAPTQRDIARLRKLLGSLNALRDCVAA